MNKEIITDIQYGVYQMESVFSKGTLQLQQDGFDSEDAAMEWFLNEFRGYNSKWIILPYFHRYEKQTK